MTTSGYKYPIGSRVMVKVTAHEDVAGIAWPYLRYKTGTVKGVEVAPVKSQPGALVIDYSIEFDEEFRGGWDCLGTCARGKGMLIGQQHLELSDTEVVDYGKDQSAT